MTSATQELLLWPMPGVSACSKVVNPHHCALFLGSIGSLNQILTAVIAPLLSFWVVQYSETPSLLEYQSALIPLVCIASIPFLISFHNRLKALKSFIYLARQS